MLKVIATVGFKLMNAVQAPPNLEKYPKDTTMPAWMRFSRYAPQRNPSNPAKPLPNSLYSPLDHSQKEVRFLRLLPESPHTVLHCSLETFRLAKAPRYLALSYEWKSAETAADSNSDPFIAHINGKPFELRRTLHEAIHAIRELLKITGDEHKPAYFWADAICINQADDRERAQQVTLMRYIYQNAYIVLANIDDQTPQPICQMACSLVAEAKNAFQERDKDWLARSLQKKEDADRWTAFEGLLTCRFWQRSWIMQEMALPKNVLVHWQGALLDLDAICALIHLLGKSCNTSALQKSPVGSLRMIDFTEIILRLGQIMQFRTDYHRSSRDLLHVLRAFSMTQASNPRDYVYSVLSLAKPYRKQELHVDYSLSLSDVLRKTAIYIIEGTGKLDLLRFAQSHSELEDLPSWAPDWSDRYYESSLKINAEWEDNEVVRSADGFCAGGPRAIDLKFSRNGRMLSVDAFVVGAITKTCFPSRSAASDATEDQQHRGSKQEKLRVLSSHLVQIVKFLESSYMEDMAEPTVGTSNNDLANFTQDQDLNNIHSEDLDRVVGKRLLRIPIIVSLYLVIINATARSPHDAEQRLQKLPSTEFVRFISASINQHEDMQSLTDPQIDVLLDALYPSELRNTTQRAYFICPLPPVFSSTKILLSHLSSYRRRQMKAILDQYLPSALSPRTFGVTTFEEKGDLVVILTGCNVPLILRPVPESSQNGSPSCYKVVSEAYVHGLMQWRDLPKLPKQTINLV